MWDRRARFCVASNLSSSILYPVYSCCKHERVDHEKMLMEYGGVIRLLAGTHHCSTAKGKPLLSVLALAPVFGVCVVSLLFASPFSLPCVCFSRV